MCLSIPGNIVSLDLGKNYFPPIYLHLRRVHLHLAERHCVGSLDELTPFLLSVLLLQRPYHDHVPAAESLWLSPFPLLPVDTREQTYDVGTREMHTNTHTGELLQPPWYWDYRQVPYSHA